MSSILHQLLRWWLNRKKQPLHFQPRTSPIDHVPWQQLLEKFVDTTGHVDYIALQQDRTLLDTYCQTLCEGPPAEGREEKLSYWINAYNAFTLAAVLQFNPKRSIREADQIWKLGTTVFDRTFFSVSGQPCSLNSIEHQVLRTMQEPRIHFAINCASASCPVLRPEAYLPDRLEEQLEAQTLQFLQDNTKNNMDQGLWRLSPIFSWFADDFGGKKGVQQFIQARTKQSKPKRLVYNRYNWALNKKA